MTCSLPDPFCTNWLMKHALTCQQLFRLHCTTFLSEGNKSFRCSSGILLSSENIHHHRCISMVIQRKLQETEIPVPCFLIFLHQCGIKLIELHTIHLHMPYALPSPIAAPTSASPPSSLSDHPWQPACNSS